MFTIDKSSNYYGMLMLPMHEDEGIRDKELGNSIEAQSLIDELSFKERIDLTNKENRELNDNLKKLETLDIDPTIKAVIQKALEKKISINEKKLLELVKGNQVINGDTIKAVKGKPDTEVIKTLTGKKERIKPILSQLTEYGKEIRTADKQLEQADKILGKFGNIDVQVEKLNKEVKAIDESIDKLKEGNSNNLNKLRVVELTNLKAVLGAFKLALIKEKDKLEDGLKHVDIHTADPKNENHSKGIQSALTNVEKEFNTGAGKAIEKYESDFKKVSNNLKTIEGIAEKQNVIEKTKEEIKKVIETNEKKITSFDSDEQKTTQQELEIKLIKQLNKSYETHLAEIEKSFLEWQVPRILDK